MDDPIVKKTFGLPDEIFLALCMIGGVLVTATLMLSILIKLKPKSDFEALTQRIKSWWLMAVIFFLAILVSDKVSIVFFAFDSIKVRYRMVLLGEKL